MTATGHALIGALIAAKFPDPLIALPLSFLSHIAADIIPHWDGGTHYKTKTNKTLFWESAVDVGVSIVASFFLYSVVLKQDNYILLYGCVLAAQLLDWLTAPYFILNIKHPFWKIFYDFQHLINTRLDKPWGILTQIATVVILYIVFFKVF